MFRGGFAHNIDEKGRVIIPLKFRLLLGEKFVITKGLDHCLWVFTDEEFRTLDEQLKAQPMLDPNAVRLQRFFSGEAVDAAIDSQGRVALPSNLRVYSRIEKEVMIVCAGNRIEIWCKSGWDALTGSLNDDLIRASAKEIGLDCAG
jgi:MraZ protein